MDRKQFAALIGFAFVAAWIALNLGYALLCLAGAAFFWFASTYAEGGIDLGELQERFGPRDHGTTTQSAASQRARVQ